VRPTRFISAALLCGILISGIAACGGDDDDGGSSSSGTGKVTGTLNGAGSTFAAPIYQQIGSDLSSQGLTLNYQPVGSGAGISQFEAGAIDFAGSDPSLEPADRQKISQKAAPIQIPFALGAITVSYNVPDLTGGLKLDGKTIADVFLGKITSWDDPAIAKQNPGTKLPSTSITVVHRSDSSGTTQGFTEFLQDYSPEWKSKVGSDKEVKWPTGTGAEGNDGVAAAIQQTEGAMGYVEQAFALQNDFTFADVKNKTGRYVSPTLASTSAAADGIDIPPDLGISTIDSPNAKAYPIVSQTFAVTYKDPCKGGLDGNKATDLKFLMDFLVSDGQATIKKLSYAPIPQNLKSKDQAAIDGMRCNGSAIGT
jgi:phosphate transport system substrate-binding protein